MALQRVPARVGGFGRRSLSELDVRTMCDQGVNGKTNCLFEAK